MTTPIAVQESSAMCLHEKDSTDVTRQTPRVLGRRRRVAQPKANHRRARLLDLFTARGLKRAEVADKADISRSYLSGLLGRDGGKGGKRMGDTIAHRIERAFDLPPGWLDWPLGSDQMRPQQTERAATASGQQASR